MREVPLLDPAWNWRPGDVQSTEFDGRACITLGEGVNLLGLPAGDHRDELVTPHTDAAVQPPDRAGDVVAPQGAEPHSPSICL